MPLDTTLYPLTHLRTDGRRWNELRHTSFQISTSPSHTGSSFLTQGHTKIHCTISGPSEPGSASGGSGSGGSSGGGGGGGRGNTAKIEVSISTAGFAGVDRQRRKGGGGGGVDKRTAEMQLSVEKAVSEVVLGSLFPHSVIQVKIYVLSSDGSVLAAIINAVSLALVDAGVPMRDYLVACTAASSAMSSGAGGGLEEDEDDDPVLDLNRVEEMELPFLTVATLGETGKVVLLVMESRVRMERVESMLAVGVDGCRRMRGLLDGVVKECGGKFA